MAKITTTEIIESLKGMSILELNELVKAIEEEFGVSAAAPVAAAGGAQEEAAQTEFDVILMSAGNSKIKVIKAVREITALGLKEAKALVDGAPQAVKEKISEDEAKSIKEKLEETGASVEVK